MIKKLLSWAHVMATTSTKKGGRFLFFQWIFFLFNTATLIERIYKPTGRTFRTYLQKSFERELVIKNTIGIFSVNPKNDSFTKSIASFEYNHQSWLAQSKNKQVFLDVGANIGFYSILAVTTYGFQHAHAFEPNPGTYARLKKNVELNNLSNKITVHTIGLSNTQASAQLTAKNVHTGGSTFVQKSSVPAGASLIDLPINTFDKVRIEHHIDLADISFIKIDVEGYEYQVLMGMQDTLPNLSEGTCLFIEIHPHAQYAKETKALIDSCQFTLVTSSKQKNFLYRKGS